MFNSKHIFGEFPVQNDEAVVLRSVEFSESSNVLTIFTRNSGKIHCLAKGARQLKNPFESSLDLMAHIFVTYISKKGEQLDLLTEAKLIKRFRPRDENYAGVFAGLYFIELLNELTADHDPNKQLFDLATATLRRFAVGTNVCRTLLRAEWKLLERIGHLPSLEHCIECNKTLDPQTNQHRIAFGLVDGGVLCSNCRSGRSQVVTVSADGLRTLNTMASSDRNLWRTLPIQNETMYEIRGLTNQFIMNLTSKRLKMLNYTSTIARYDRQEEMTEQPKQINQSQHKDTDVQNAKEQ
ncbi:MAG: DNA repair protein RecO [Planctomycetaceae bacterium]|jgi:DNA repair protein RecO (recombination protein O)|nr:DNA repair protein RecO [Planctomycetaceae bacterium]